jgi:hypothetical protein
LFEASGSAACARCCLECGLLGHDVRSVVGVAAGDYCTQCGGGVFSRRLATCQKIV